MGFNSGFKGLISWGNMNCSGAATAKTCCMNQNSASVSRPSRIFFPPSPLRKRRCCWCRFTCHVLLSWDIIIIIIIIIFNLRTTSFKAYCAIWVRRSNSRHQASPCVSPRESTRRRKVELWARNVRKFCLNADFNVTFRDLLHAVKLRHGTDGFTYPPKIRRLRPGANPRTWVPKASTLPLDHRSRWDRYTSRWNYSLLVRQQC